jgi:hypothetical protein
VWSAASNRFPSIHTTIGFCVFTAYSSGTA